MVVYFLEYCIKAQHSLNNILYLLTFIIPNISVPSEPPTHMEAMLLNATAVYLKWKPPPPSSHNGLLRGYQVQTYI